MRNTHKWALIVEKAAQRDIDALSDKNRQRVFDSLRDVLRSENPCSVLGVEKMKCSERTWKIRQGDYRIIFDLDTRTACVTFDIYKGQLILKRVAIHHTGY